jgi:PAS domain S-box-containing protein
VFQGGEVTGLEGFIIDTTAQKQARTEYQMLFEKMLSGFALHEIIRDQNGRPLDYRFLAVNPAFERLTGLKANDIIGRTVLEILPATEPFWIETYARVALTGDPAYFENYHQALDRHFEVMAYRLAEGKFACIFNDVTERREWAGRLRSERKRSDQA